MKKLWGETHQSYFFATDPLGDFSVHSSFRATVANEHKSNFVGKLAHLLLLMLLLSVVAVME